MSSLPDLTTYSAMNLLELGDVLRLLHTTPDRSDLANHLNAIEARLHAMRTAFHTQHQQMAQEPTSSSETNQPPSKPVPFRLLIAGSRHATPPLLKWAYIAVERAKANEWAVLVGDAEGVDTAVISACNELGVDYVCFGIADTPRSSAFKPVKDGGKGRYVRHNGSYTERDRRMADVADRGLFLWNGNSKGTYDAYEYMRDLGKPADLLKSNDITRPQKAVPPTTTATSTASASISAVHCVELIIDTEQVREREAGSNFATFESVCGLRALDRNGEPLLEKRLVVTAQTGSSDCAKLQAIKHCLTLLKMRAKDQAIDYELRVLQSSKNVDGWLAREWKRNSPPIAEVTSDIDTLLKHFPQVDSIKLPREKVQELLSGIA